MKTMNPRQSNSTRRWGGWVVLALACSTLRAGADPVITPSTLESPPPIASERPLRYHALVIGINDYAAANGQGWNKLSTARNDAQSLAEVLRQQYGFEVTSLLDGAATRAAIMEQLDQMSQLGEDDAVLIYFAGHGLYDEALGEGFWIPSDARKTTGQRLPKEDWIWNSTVTTIVGASKARHILIIADSCYGGSLFRGGLDEILAGDMTWYRNALAKSSRFLITSGDLEPVLDSGQEHGVFAESLLQFLQHPDKDVFAASEVGMALRNKVGALTGQMVRSGPLALAKNAGGEFIFIRNGATVDALLAPPPPAQDFRPEFAKLQDVALLANRGAVQSANLLLADVRGQNPAEPMGGILSTYLDPAAQNQQRDSLRALLARIQEQKRNPGQKNPDNAPRPLILACLGPTAQGGSTEAEGRALLYRLTLRSLLEEQSRITVVEREALESVLKEMEIGSSDLADPSAQLQLGRFLPAGFLLMGDVWPETGRDNLYLRIVDTETSQILASFSSHPDSSASLLETCRELAGKIAQTLQDKAGTSSPPPPSSH